MKDLAKLSDIISKLDILQFSKMFSYNIPVGEHAKYYFNQLIKSKQFEKLPAQIEAFYEFQNSLPEGVTAKKFKLDLSDQIVDKLKELGIAEELNKIDLSGHSFQSQTPTYEPGYYYVSVDLNQANWNVYKKFGGLETDLNWEDWIKKEFNAPDAICMSKIFRQIIFGNLNPKRVTKIQEMVTNNNIKQALEAQRRDEHEGIVGVSADEIIIKFKKDQIMFDSDPASFIKSELPRKFKIFTILEMPVFNSLIKLEVVHNPIDLTPTYKALRDVPGNRFWMYFNTVILGEQLDILERDLMFLNEGKLAKWVL